MKDFTLKELRGYWDLAGEEESYRLFIKGDLSGGMNEEGNFKESGFLDVEELQKGLQKFNLTFWEKDILEIGCGAGRMAEYFVKKAKSYIGIDISKEMIKRCKERCSGIDCRVEEDLSNFKARSFNFIFSYATLQHVPKDIVRKYFQQMKKILRKDGIIVFQLPIGNKADNKPAYEFDIVNIEKLKDKNSSKALGFREWTKEEFEELIDGFNLFNHFRMPDGSYMYILTL